MKKLILIGFAVLAVVLVGCTVQYSDSAVTGNINGEAFTFVDGYCEDDGTVRMYDEAKDFSDSFAVVLYGIIHSHIGYLRSFCRNRKANTACLLSGHATGAFHTRPGGILYGVLLQ